MRYLDIKQLYRLRKIKKYLNSNNPKKKGWDLMTASHDANFDSNDNEKELSGTASEKRQHRQIRVTWNQWNLWSRINKRKSTAMGLIKQFWHTWDEEVLIKFFILILQWEKLLRWEMGASLACINLSHNFLAQSLGGGDSGMKT